MGVKIGEICGGGILAQPVGVVRTGGLLSVESRSRGEWGFSEHQDRAALTSAAHQIHPCIGGWVGEKVGGQ